MASIVAALKRIKQLSLGSVQRSVIEGVCRELGHHWRHRDLDPATTVALFIQQVIHGNAPCTEVRHLAGRDFSASAYCQARARLPLAVYQTLLSKVVAALLPQSQRVENLWHGHRTFHIDGSTFSMPDTPQLRLAFGTPSGQRPGCGFPVAHLLVLFNAPTGLLMDAWASPLLTGDLAHAPEAHQRLKSGDVLIGDNNFSGYPHLAVLLARNLHGLFPIHRQRLVDFTPRRPHVQLHQGGGGLPHSRWIKSLGKDDQLVEYFRPTHKSPWMTPQQYQALPPSIVVRELRRTVDRPAGGKMTLTMVTTLLDPLRYPAQELAMLRLRRWDVETRIGELKTTMKMEALRCKSESGVRKELAVFCLVYNLVRAVMLEAARRQQVAVARISFADTLKWMRHAKAADLLPDLLINPSRHNRIEPRAVKRRPKKYDRLTRPRAVHHEELKKQRETS
jgi:hypothetical protein